MKKCLLTRNLPLKCDKQKIIDILSNYLPDFIKRINEINSIYVTFKGVMRHYYVKLQRRISSSEYKNLFWIVFELEETSSGKKYRKSAKKEEKYEEFIFFMYNMNFLIQVCYKNHNINYQSVLFESCDFYVLKDPFLLQESDVVSESEKRIIYNQFIGDNYKYENIEIQAF